MKMLLFNIVPKIVKNINYLNKKDIRYQSDNIKHDFFVTNETVENANLDFDNYSKYNCRSSYYYRCHNYALDYIIGGKNNISFDIALMIRDNLFTETINPKKGDLVVYSNQYSETHFAVYINNDVFESKLGNVSNILRHRPYTVFDFYGTNIKYYKLKNESLRKKNRS